MNNFVEVCGEGKEEGELGREGEGTAGQGGAAAASSRQCCPESQRACTFLLSLPPSPLVLVIMSWPSFYGYKYTPIGLRQREKKDDYSGTRSICTTVHLPQGGHLLDIERQYGIDGSMSKRVSATQVTWAVGTCCWSQAPVPPPQPTTSIGINK